MISSIFKIAKKIIKISNYIMYVAYFNLKLLLNITFHLINNKLKDTLRFLLYNNRYHHIHYNILNEIRLKYIWDVGCKCNPQWIKCRNLSWVSADGLSWDQPDDSDRDARDHWQGRELAFPNVGPNEHNQKLKSGPEHEIVWNWRKKPKSGGFDQVKI